MLTVGPIQRWYRSPSAPRACRNASAMKVLLAHGNHRVVPHHEKNALRFAAPASRVGKSRQTPPNSRPPALARGPAPSRLRQAFCGRDHPVHRPRVRGVYRNAHLLERAHRRQPVDGPRGQHQVGMQRGDLLDVRIRLARPRAAGSWPPAGSRKNPCRPPRDRLSQRKQRLRHVRAPAKQSAGSPRHRHFAPRLVRYLAHRVPPAGACAWPRSPRGRAANSAAIANSTARLSAINEPLFGRGIPRRSSFPLHFISSRTPMSNSLGLDPQKKPHEKSGAH